MGQELNMHNEQKIIERLKRLPPQQLDEVIQFIDFISERRQMPTFICKTDDLKNSIFALRGRGRGEHLVERLLQSRREDKKLDEQR